QRAAPFETMIPTDIVIHARLQTRHGGHNRVTFRWMQVATGRITAECPASCFKLFPGGEAKGELEQDGQRVLFQPAEPNGPRDMEVRIGGQDGVGEQRQLNNGSSSVGAKWIGLSSPVEMTWGLGIVVHMMLGALMVRERTADRLYGVAGQRCRQVLRAIVQHTVLQEPPTSVTSEGAIEILSKSLS